MSNSKSKIWIITEYYSPELVSTGYCMTGIAEFLSKSNDVSVICASKSKFKNEKINNVNIYRISSPNLDKNKIIQRTIKYLILSFKFFFQILFKVRKGDKILAVTNPAFLPIFVAIIRKLKRVQFLLLVHDLFPENLIATRLMKDNTIGYKFLKHIFRRTYICADHIIVIGRDMEVLIRKKIEPYEVPISIITNWADTGTVFPRPKQDIDILIRNFLANKFVVLFAGNLGRAQGIDFILNCAELINDQDIHFLFIGNGTEEELIKKHISLSKTKNVTWLESMPRSKQCDFLNACDIALITLREGYVGLGVPSKTYNILAAGKPLLLISDAGSEVELMIKEANIGFFVDVNRTDLFMEVIRKAKDDKDALIAKGINSRKLAEEVYAKEVVLSRFNKVLEN